MRGEWTGQPLEMPMPVGICHENAYVFMLVWTLSVGVTDGRQTPRPPETPTDDVHEAVARILLSALSDDSRPVVVCHLKRPNHGQRRVPLRSGWTPSLPVTWG